MDIMVGYQSLVLDTINGHIRTSNQKSFTHFSRDKDAKVTMYQPFASKMRTCSLTDVLYQFDN